MSTDPDIPPPEQPPQPKHHDVAHKGRGKGESRTSPRRIESKERAQQAVELRKAGAPYHVIADKLGYADAGSAAKAIERTLKAMLQEPCEALRKLELERLDAMLLGVWPGARSGNQGAIDRVLRIMERRAKLTGLDAPTEVNVAQVLKGYVGVSPDDWPAPGQPAAAPAPGPGESIDAQVQRIVQAAADPAALAAALETALQRLRPASSF